MHWLACWMLVTYEETSFTMCGATGVTIQPHQILRLSHRKTRLRNLCHIWNVIYNEQSNRCHEPTSPNIAPATKNDTAKFQRKCPKTGVTSFTMRGRSEHDPTMIRESEWNRHSATRLATEVTFRPYHEHFRLKNTLFRVPAFIIHPVLHLPRKMTRLLNPRHIWNGIYNARSNWCHDPTSPNMRRSRTQKDPRA